MHDENVFRTLAKKIPSTLSSLGPTKYVAYYRVSTRAEGDSGLGLEAQRSAVANFVEGLIDAEFTKIESGKHNQRVQLAAAIDWSKKDGAILVIAKLDRLNRNASLIFTFGIQG